MRRAAPRTQRDVFRRLHRADRVSAVLGGDDRFALLAPATGALALSATTGLVLVTAWRRHLHALAWLATIGACALAACCSS